MPTLPLTWSTAHPSEPGYYWFRSPASEPTLVRVRADEAHIALVAAPGWVDYLDDGETDLLEPGVGDEWAGPLLPPS